MYAADQAARRAAKRGGIICRPWNRGLCRCWWAVSIDSWQVGICHVASRLDGPPVGTCLFWGGGCSGQLLPCCGALVCTLLWRHSFAKFFFRVFSRKMRSKSVLVYRNEAFCNHSDAYKRQIQRVGTSGLKSGSRAEPWCSFFRLSSKERAPARGRAGPRGAAPQRVLPRDTPEGYALPRHRHPASGWVAHRFLALR